MSESAFVANAAACGWPTVMFFRARFVIAAFAAVNHSWASAYTDVSSLSFLLQIVSRRMCF